MKKQIVLVLFLFLLTACAPSETNDTIAPENGQMETGDEHVGCQEGEIKQDGSCVPAKQENNNAGIFDQNPDPFVRVEEINNEIIGFLAEPQEAGVYPGIVMIHEWWGLNDNIKQMAKLLAKEGYVVFAIDLYDGVIGSDSKQAAELATAVRSNPQAAVEKMQKAVDYLQQVKKVPKVASLGWCFGGQQSLLLSVNDTLDATVIYYGQLIDDKDKLAHIAWPVLGIFGEKDMSITVKSVRNFEAVLNQLKIANQIYVYPGVGHAFANPSGSNYAANETRDAWAKTLSFLEQNLK